jgi:hypothetical protein
MALNPRKPGITRAGKTVVTGLPDFDWLTPAMCSAAKTLRDQGQTIIYDALIMRDSFLLTADCRLKAGNRSVPRTEVTVARIRERQLERLSPRQQF